MIEVPRPYMNYLNNSSVFLNDNELLTPPDARNMDSPVERWSFNIWNIQNAAIEKKIAGPAPDKAWDANSPRAFAMSPDGSIAVPITQKSGLTQFRTNLNEPIFNDFRENPVPVYSTKTWEILQKIPVVFPTSVAFSADGRQLAFGGGARGKIEIYDTETWQPVREIKSCEYAAPADTIAFSPDGKAIVVGTSVYSAVHNTCGVRIFRIRDGALVGSYSDEMAGGPWQVLWHPSGKFIVFAPHDRTLRIWDPNKPGETGLIIKDINSMCLSFSPDGSKLASCNNGEITLFDVNL